MGLCFPITHTPDQDERPADSAGGVVYAVGNIDYSGISPRRYHIKLPGHATVYEALDHVEHDTPEEFTLYEIRPIGRFKQTRGVKEVG